MSRKPPQGVKNLVLRKVQGLVIEKLVKISIRYLVYSQRLHYQLNVERFSVCQPKSVGVPGPKAASAKHKIAATEHT